MPGIFLPSLSHQALPAPAGRQRAPITWRRSLGCARFAASPGRRARERDVLLWGRFSRHLDRNVSSRNLHRVAHSSHPDWGNGPRGCFAKGFSESYFLPTELVHANSTVPLISAAVAETNVVGRVSGWIRSFCLSFASYYR